MQKIILNYNPRALTNSLLFLFTVLLMVPACKKINPNEEATAKDEEVTLLSKSAKSLLNFKQVNLVANNDEYGAARVDSRLVNGWGMAFAPTGPTWVSSEGLGISVIYNSAGNDVRPLVTIPSPGASTGGHPSGQVFNGSNNFKLPNGSPARFIFAGLDGVISAWNSLAVNSAVKMIDDSPDAVYTGITLASDGGINYLYAANFSERKIDVYDTAWIEVSRPFVDPDLPEGYSPFNIQNLDGKLYVMYAKVGPDGDEEKGKGKGLVDVYNPDGSFVKRFYSHGQLNAPWGITKALPGFFGDGKDQIENAILIGNFGNGRINVFNEKGQHFGMLHDSKHDQPIEIEGLWGISFAPATATTVNPNWLFFAAGPDDEQDGLFGYLSK